MTIERPEIRKIVAERADRLLAALSRLEQAAQSVDEGASGYARANSRKTLAEAALDYAGVVNDLLGPEDLP